MEHIHVGLVADPAAPTEIGHKIEDRHRSDADGRWDLELVSDPFTTGCEDAETAFGRLGDHGREHDWDLVVGLTELPIRDEDGRYLLVEVDPDQQKAIVSLPALGGVRMHTRTRRAVRTVVRGMG